MTGRLLPGHPPPILAKGFRLFFLLAALDAVVLVPLWLAGYAGAFDPGSYLAGWTWHAHEMVYGYAVAVVAGFLLTAASNWTGQETATGGWLAALGLVWLAGRVTVLASAALPPVIVAVANLAFLPFLAAAVGRPIVAMRNRRNYGLVALLFALWAAQAGVHLSALGWVSEWRRQGSLVGVDLLVLVIVVITARVVPSFTRNATKAEAIRSHAWLDRATFGGMALLTLLDALGVGQGAAPWLAGITGLAAAGRAVHWGARHTADKPILWVLHVGHAWVPLGLWLRFAEPFVDPLTPMLATHALTIGAIGTLTLGMMSRVALGHTGRPLRLARPVAFAFGIVTLSALTRVFGPLVVPEWTRAWVMVAGALWTAAFAVYLLLYAPILVRPRADGRPG